MERKSTIKKASEPKEEVQVIVFNVHQACNLFQLTGTTRTHILKKFQSTEGSRADWESILYAERVVS